jgi:hypothetical protein
MHPNKDGVQVIVKKITPVVERALASLSKTAEPAAVTPTQ